MGLIYLPTDDSLAHCEAGYPPRGRSFAGELLSSLRSLVAASAGRDGAAGIRAPAARRGEAEVGYAVTALVRALSCRLGLYW